MLVLREAKRADHPALLMLVRSAFEEYRGALDPPSSAHAETLSTIDRTMLTARAAIAEVDGEPAGAVFYESYVDHVSLFRLSVLRAHRRRGVGGALVDHVECYARAEAVARVLLTVRLALAENRAFYERRGYLFVHTRDAHAILEKRLTTS